MTLEQYARKIRGMKKRKDPVEVLAFIRDHYLDCHYPLEHVVLFGADDDNYSVGDLIKETIIAAMKRENGYSEKEITNKMKRRQT